MIKAALEFLQAELNQYIYQQAGLTLQVVLNNPVDIDGSAITTNSSKLVITLVNIEEERVAKAQTPYRDPASDGTIVLRNPEIKLNLYVLFSADTGTDGANYDEALRRVGFAISYFQAKSDFNLTNSPGLDPSIKKLKADLYTLPIEQQNYLWGAIGAKYQPSVIYRLRMLTYQEDSALSLGQQIENVQTNMNGM